MKERYRTMMEQISLDEQARERIEDKLTQGGKVHRKARLRPILAAACVCLALVGVVFAAEAVFGIPVFQSFGGNGFRAVLTEPESGETVGIAKQPETIFSSEVLAAAGEQNGWVEFKSWADAEEYLGVNMMDNAVLADAWYYADGEIPPAWVRLFAIDGKITAARVGAVYLMNEKELDDGNSVPVRVSVGAALFTENSPIGEDEMLTAYEFPEGYTFSTETYTAPSGLSALIVGVNDPESGTTSYIAQFGWRGVAFSVDATFNPDPGHALSTLKQVLDSFE